MKLIFALCVLATFIPTMCLPISHASGAKTVIVFGCFDLLHEGHKNFLVQASTYGNVIAVVTRDSMVKKLKNRIPVNSEEIRLQAVKNFPGVSLAILGDEELGEYLILKEYSPDMICLGYDQKGLGEDLTMRMAAELVPEIPLIYLQPYLHEIYHTSIIRTQLKL